MNGFRFAVAHHDSVFQGRAAGVVRDKGCLLLRDGLESLGIAVVRVLVGHKDQIRLRKLGVVRQPTVGIHVNGLAAKEEQKRSMSDEGDRELTLGSLNPIRFKWVGDASHYGSEPGNVNYAIDIPDVEDATLTDPNGIGGWI